MEDNKLLLGCIADDFTGAGDIASFLKKGGLHTILCSQIPQPEDIPAEAEAVVISLKSRTAEVKDAVEDTLRSIRVLEEYGCEKYYIKYCSTFDSTPEGNIGPVLDAVLEYMDERYTVICPSLPVNGRTVRDGILYVNGIPLSESSMKNHPLTPMWDSRISILMREQSKYPCIVLKREDMLQKSKEVWTAISSKSKKCQHYYLVPDYEKEEDAAQIVRIFKNLKVITGGSGLALSYAKYLSERVEEDGKKEKSILAKSADGPSVMTAGSVSNATIEQIKNYKEAGHFFYKIDPKRLWQREITADSIWKELESIVMKKRESVLIYCSEGKEDIKKGQSYGKYEFAALLEDTLAEISAKAVKKGIQKIIAAGGETSGAVTKRLGYKYFYVGESVAPGVPVLVPVNDCSIRLILKSGNFGKKDFFMQAVNMLNE